MNKERTEEQNRDLLTKERVVENVVLPIKEVSRLTGASPTQIRYWTKKEHVKSERNGHYEYRFRELQKIDLIARYIRKGLSLDVAVERAERILERIKREEQRAEKKEGESTRPSWEDLLEEIGGGTRGIAEELLEDPHLRNLLVEEVVERILQRVGIKDFLQKMGSSG